MRIALLGGECTGKSTVAELLAIELHAPVATEVLREFVTEHGRVPEQHEQAAILRAQREREDALLATHPTVVCDPATLMTAVYSHLYFDDDALTELGIAQARDYDLILWCRPDFPWHAEAGQHDGPEFRARADARIDELRGLIDTPLVELRGTPTERMHAAQQALAVMRS